MLSETLSDLLTYSADGFFLVVAVCDPVVNRNGHQILPLGTTVHQLLQIIFAEYAADFTLWAALIVPEVGFKTIGCEHHRTATKFAFQAICVQHRLLASNVRVFAGSLGLNNRQWQTVLAKQDIVHISHLADNASHPFNRVFFLYICICAGEFPAHLLHVHIDVNFTSLELGKVCCDKGALLLVLLLCCGDLLGHLLDLFTQRLNLCILLTKQTLLLFYFLGVDNDFFGRNQCLIELPLFVIGAIAIVHPLDELKTSLQGSKSITSLNAALCVNGQVA